MIRLVLWPWVRARPYRAGLALALVGALGLGAMALSMDMLRRQAELPGSAYQGAAFGHPYGDEMQVWPAGRFFVVGLRGLPDKACAEIAYHYVAESRAGENPEGKGLVAVMVRETIAGASMMPPEVAIDGSVRGGTKAPFSGAEIDTACRFGANANDLYIVFGDPKAKERERQDGA